MLQTPANPYNIRTFQLPCFAFFPFITPAAAAAKLLQSCPTLRDPIDGHRRRPTRLPHPWDSPGKNTGVGCHFLLQCMKVKSESEVAQSCPTLRDPMDCSLPGSSVHGIFQARVLEWVAIAFSAAYLRLLIFLPAILIPACASSSLAFHMMYIHFYLALTSFTQNNYSEIHPCHYTYH